LFYKRTKLDPRI